MSSSKPSSQASQLALHGGPPTIATGPPTWPPMDEDVRQALDRSFADGSWGQYHGRHCAALADELAQLHGTPHVLLCCSGTVAVELALRGLGITTGDEVLLAGYDFPGNFRSIEAVGARPVLVDVDSDNWNLDPRGLEAALSDKTRAVIVSHLHGGLVPMRELTDAARRHGLAVVEDACQATGAMVEGRVAGSWGDVGVLSVGGSKLLSAGRGGALLTRREDVFQRVKIFSDRGNQAFPLSELQAAVLIPQLQKLAERNAIRTQRVEQLLRRCRNLPGLRPLVNRTENSKPAYYKLGFQYRPEDLHGLPAGEFAAAVRAEGVALDTGFRGFVLRGPRRCRMAGTLEHSRQAAEGMLVLHHPVLLESAETIDRAAAAIQKVVHAMQQKS